MGEMLQCGSEVGQSFELHKLPARIQCTPDVFRETSGVYIIHARHYHEEDLVDTAGEHIEHYMTYHAGTRLLYMYPEAIVLEDKDVLDIPSFLERIKQVPFQTEVDVGPGSAHRWVRQLYSRCTSHSLHAPTVYRGYVEALLAAQLANLARKRARLEGA